MKWLIGVAASFMAFSAMAQVTLTGYAVTAGGQTIPLTPNAIFVQSCNGGAGGIVGQGSCALPSSSSGGGSSTLTPATHAQSAALASNLVIKASAGNLYSFNAVADSTLSAATWYLLIFDATSLPANGAVTPAKCYAVPAGQLTFGGTLGTGGVAFTTGITMGVSTTGCYTLTASTHAALMGDYQ